MTVTLVHVFVKPEFITEFVKATQKNHELSTQEPGNLRFDILQDAMDPSKFVLYEAYESEEAVVAHKTKAHYFEWRDTVGPWMAKDRFGIKHKLLFPAAH